LLDSAARDRINLSEHIADAEHIHIPHTDEPLVAAASATAPTGTSAGNADVINLNTATASELEVLPKVGPALAGRIVAWRTANGPFQSVDDLRKVTGIGPALFDAIKDLVRISQ
jgi:competence protein ComEA